MGIDDLNQRFGRAGAIVFSMSRLGGVVVTLSAHDTTVVVALQGAQVLSWVSGGVERLWLSPAARLGTGKAVRGGIPVCWPWFGPHQFDPDKPAHGFVRTRVWDAVETRAEVGAVSVTLNTMTDDVDLAVWPHEGDVRLTVGISGHGRLSLALETENFGLAPFALSQALHTYFRVGAIEQVRVEGLDGRTYIDKLDGGARKSGSGNVIVDREVDRIYLGVNEPISLVDAAKGARIEIRSEGSRSAVVWNPWIEKTARLGDMGSPDAYRRMLCIETTNAADDMVLVQPGNRHMMRTTYRVF